jgi:hypothetical protein
MSEHLPQLLNSIVGKSGDRFVRAVVTLYDDRMQQCGPLSGHIHGKENRIC